jgi:hypothetical protein
VDNNYLDSGMSKSGFIHTLPSGRLMSTRCTNQLFLKPQPWQSSNQIEFTQVRQKVKA